MAEARDPAVYLELYRACFAAALAVTLAALVLVVFLFFRLDIRGILRRRSGFPRKKAARPLRRRGRGTGRLAANELLGLDRTGRTGGKEDDGED